MLICKVKYGLSGTSTQSRGKNYVSPHIRDRSSFRAFLHVLLNFNRKKRERQKRMLRLLLWIIP